MVTRRNREPEPEPEPQPESESEPVASTDPHTTGAPDSTLADDQVSEYQTEDGSTYLLTAKEAEKRGAKAVGKPENKAANPQNK